jgi:hypothetical protein
MGPPARPPWSSAGGDDSTPSGSLKTAVPAVRAFLDAASARAGAWAGLQSAFAPFAAGAAGGEAGYRAAAERAAAVFKETGPASAAAAAALRGAGRADLAAVVESVAADEAHRARVAVALHALRKAGADAEKGGDEEEPRHHHTGTCGCGGGSGGAAASPPPPPPPDAGLDAARDAADRRAAVGDATAELEEVAGRINEGLAELREAVAEAVAEAVE